MGSRGAIRAEKRFPLVTTADARPVWRLPLAIPSARRPEPPRGTSVVGRGWCSARCAPGLGRALPTGPTFSEGRYGGGLGGPRRGPEPPRRGQNAAVPSRRRPPSPRALPPGSGYGGPAGHPGIVATFDAGVTPLGEAGAGSGSLLAEVGRATKAKALDVAWPAPSSTAFIVMELVPGETLRDLIARACPSHPIAVAAHCSSH